MKRSRGQTLPVSSLQNLNLLNKQWELQAASPLWAGLMSNRSVNSLHQVSTLVSGGHSGGLRVEHMS